MSDPREVIRNDLAGFAEIIHAETVEMLGERIRHHAVDPHVEQALVAHFEGAGLGHLDDHDAEACGFVRPVRLVKVDWRLDRCAPGEHGRGQ